jgi:PAS domain S-box-containing protein
MPHSHDIRTCLRGRCLRSIGQRYKACVIYYLLRTAAEDGWHTCGHGNFSAHQAEVRIGFAPSIHWNAGAERLFGYSAEEALGKSVRILIPPDLSEEERQILEAIKEGKVVEHYETLRKTKDGRHVLVSVSISPIRNNSGRVVGASTIAREIRPDIQNS